MTEKENPTISIIVPVYNTEQYLQRCLDSISKSTFKNFEVIVVDDGSTDSSPEICDRFEKNDYRFHVIHTDNKGVSHARNIGLENAKGQFITFIDSDDEIGIDRLESLVLAEPAEIIFGQYVNVTKTGSSIVRFSDIEEVSVEQYREQLCSNINNKLAVVWCGCYLRQIIKDNHLGFDETKTIGEDILFNLSYLEHCKSIRFINNCEYYHNNIKSSLINSFYKNYDHEEEELKTIELFCRKVNQRNRFYIWHKVINHFEIWQHCDDEHIRKKAKRENKRCYKNSYFRESIPFIRKEGTLDERIETYLMGYYRHKLFKPILKVLKVLKG